MVWIVIKFLTPVEVLAVCYRGWGLWVYEKVSKNKAMLQAIACVTNGTALAHTSAAIHWIVAVKRSEVERKCAYEEEIQ